MPRGMLRPPLTYRVEPPLLSDLACASDSVVAGDCLLHNLWSPGCFYEARKGTAHKRGRFPKAHRAEFSDISGPGSAYYLDPMLVSTATHPLLV
jgi:hypothetical protein